MNQELLYKYLFPDQKNLKRMLSHDLKTNGYNSTSKKGYLYAPGTYPVLLCAHLDTVHKDPVNQIIQRYNFIESPNGIGGDDRCGVYIIMQLIKYYHCSVLFLEDEEIGGVGAHQFAFSEFAAKESQFSNYIIEFDRKGARDAVFYSCANYEFEDFITSSGYFQKAFGTFSDISVIAPAIGLAAVNLSSGYYKEHTVDEYINLKDIDNIIAEAKKLLAEDSGKYIYKRAQSRVFSRYKYSSFYDGYDLYNEGGF